MNELINIQDKELNGKIFTFDPIMQGRDVDKNMNDLKLERIVMGLKCMKGVEPDTVPSFKFFKIQKSYVEFKETEQCMVCFIDISSKILYDSTRAESDMLSLINATISHEMRNPLNSIINECKIVSILIKSVIDNLNDNKNKLPYDLYEDTMDKINCVFKRIET